MPEIQKLFDRKKEASGQVSAQTRVAGLGLLAAGWALLTAHDEPLHSMSLKVNRNADLGLVALGFLIIACDLLQYVAIVSYTNAAIRKAKEAQTQTAPYDDESFAYRAHDILYFSKFGLLVGGGLLIAWIFVQLARHICI